MVDGGWCVSSDVCDKSSSNSHIDVELELYWSHRWTSDFVSDHYDEMEHDLYWRRCGSANLPTNCFIARRLCIAHTMLWQYVHLFVCLSHARFVPKRLTNRQTVCIHHYSRFPRNTPAMYSVSQKKSPPRGPNIFFIFFTNGWEFVIDFLHTY